MNSTGRELSQADLIRNFILMGLEPKQQTQLYEDHWRPMERNFGQEAYGSHFDSFMRHYLTLKTGEIPNVRAVYEAFKAYSREPQVASGGVDDLVRDIRAFAGYYCAMAWARNLTKFWPKPSKTYGNSRSTSPIHSCWSFIKTMRAIYSRRKIL